MDLHTFQFFQSLARNLAAMEINYFHEGNTVLTDAENPFRLLPRIFAGGKVPTMTTPVMDAIESMISDIEGMPRIFGADAAYLAEQSEAIGHIRAFLGV